MPKRNTTVQLTLQPTLMGRLPKMGIRNTGNLRKTYRGLRGPHKGDFLACASGLWEVFGDESGRSLKRKTYPATARLSVWHVPGWSDFMADYDRDVFWVLKHIPSWLLLCRLWPDQNLTWWDEFAVPKEVVIYDDLHKALFEIVHRPGHFGLSLEYWD